MFTFILTIAAAIVSAVLAGFVARRILDTPVGWPRSIVVGLLVFFAALPFAGWVLDETGVLSPGRQTSNAIAGVVAIAIIILAFAWVFAVGLAVLVALEAIFPTVPLPNPIAVVRAAIRRRKRTSRYLQILTIASRHGVGEIFTGRQRVDQELTTREQRARALVAAINDSGVTFVKLGQVLSTRRDLIPEPYLSALASLQSSATTLPWDAVRPVIEHDIGAPLETVFTSIEPAPLAAASVAQVHSAVLRDGTPVVVKVQRPSARAQVEADVDIILRLAHRAETRTWAGQNLRLESVARGFTTTLLGELDYRGEVLNTEMLRTSLALIAAERDAPPVDITVPRVFAQASGPRVMTMELVDGVPLSRAGSRLDAMTTRERQGLALALMSTVIEQMLVHGVFHADLHPGNVILREDGSLGMIDFGAVGIVERSQRQRLSALLLAAASEDDVAATDALLLLVDVPVDIDLDAFRHDIGVVLTSEMYRPGGDGSIFARIVDVIRDNRIALPGQLASAFRSLATLEGCLSVMSPGFNLVGQALAVVPKMLRRTVSLRRTAISAQARAVVLAELASGMPQRMNVLLNDLQGGRIGIRLTSDEADQSFVRSIASQLIGTLVSIAAVVIAIVLAVTAAGPVLIGEIRLFDLLGALIGFFGFLGLLRAVRQTFVRRR